MDQGTRSSQRAGYAPRKRKKLSRACVLQALMRCLLFQCVDNSSCFQVSMETFFSSFSLFVPFPLLSVPPSFHPLFSLIFFPIYSQLTNESLMANGDGIPVELFQNLKDDAVKMLHSICQQIWKTQQWPQDWKRSVFIPVPRKVKQGLGSITMNKPSGGDGIPVELFQILKDDAVKVLAFNMSANLENSAVASGLEKVSFIPVPKKGNAKECSNYLTIALISQASKVMCRILQDRLLQYVNHELPDVQVGFRKGRGTRDQIANICWITEKARESQKNIYFCFIDYTKAFDCVHHHKLWKRWEYQTTFHAS